MKISSFRTHRNQWNCSMCTRLLKSGLRKGQACGKPRKHGDFCGVHRDKHEPAAAESKISCAAPLPPSAASAAAPIDPEYRTRRSLFPHQLDSLERLENMEKTHCKEGADFRIESDLGIYADPVGSGKTITLLSLIARDRYEPNLQTYDHFLAIGGRIAFASKVPRVRHYSNKYANSTLVVSTNSVISHWQKELQYTDLAAYVISTRAQVDALRNMEVPPLVLCTATMYPRLLREIGATPLWKRFVVDEADSIQIPNFQSVNAAFTWLVTATASQFARPKRGRGGRSWIVDLFTSCACTENVLHDDYFVQCLQIRTSLPIRFEWDEVKEVVHEHRGSQMVAAVRPFVSADIARLLEAGNMAEAIRQLGGASTNKSLFDVVTKRLTFDLDIVRSRISSERKCIRKSDLPDEERKKTKKELALEKLLAEEKFLETQIEKLRVRFERCLVEVECCICFDPAVEPTLVSCCQNIMCGGCILKWMSQKASCPLCRAPLEAAKLVHLSKTSTEVSDDEEKKASPSRDVDATRTRQEIITAFAKENPEAKILIFSEFDETWETVTAHLGEQRVDFRIFHGSKAMKDKRQREFEAGVFPVLLINSRANGAGIHLPFVTDIFFYHSMPRELREQVVGRGRRMGRTNQLTVHHFRES